MTDLRGSLKTIQELLDKPHPFSSEPGQYAEYLDEEDPSAGVVIRNAKGYALMLMPLEVWDQLRDPNYIARIREK